VTVNPGNVYRASNVVVVEIVNSTMKKPSA
jgi:hypothetical protein